MNVDCYSAAAFNIAHWITPVKISTRPRTITINAPAINRNSLTEDIGSIYSASFVILSGFFRNGTLSRFDNLSSILSILFMRFVYILEMFEIASCLELRSLIISCISVNMFDMTSASFLIDFTMSSGMDSSSGLFDSSIISLELKLIVSVELSFILILSHLLKYGFGILVEHPGHVTLFRSQVVIHS